MQAYNKPVPDRTPNSEKNVDFPNTEPQEHILVCLSASPSNEKVVRAAARMAEAYGGSLTALFVETPSYPSMRAEDRKQLRANKRLAEQLGANIEIIYGEDVPYQIADYAHLFGISKIVVGRSGVNHIRIFKKPSETERLISLIPGIAFYIIPDISSNSYYRAKNVGLSLSPSQIFLDIVKCFVILILATLLGIAFTKLGMTTDNVITIYILGVLVISVITSARAYSLVSSCVSVLMFNYYFTAPKFTFVISESVYLITFAVMFLSALLTSSLAAKLKSQARQASQSVFRNNVLFDTNRLLQRAHSDAEIVNVTANQLIMLLDRDLVFYPANGDVLGQPHLFPVTADGEILLADSEKLVAEWALKNNDHAGATTTAFPSAAGLYLAIRKDATVYGVVGIRIADTPLDSFENNVLLSILGECALTLENSRNNREKEAAAVLAKNEQLRSNLLRTISHDLRTPLTSISGNASNLLSNSSDFDEETKSRIYTDIYDDSMWLISLVENLLSITRFDQGSIKLRLSAEIVDDVIAEALRYAGRKSSEHHITVESGDDLILAMMDSRLIVQVISNLLDNAFKYTPVGSNITISAEKVSDFVVVSVADDGQGISDEIKPQIFDMFFSGANKVADSRRSLGLGLSLCKSIITAHGGEISVQDNHPTGTIVRFTLPAGEVNLHE